MARPRVFISSTYYDLKQTRENLAQFIHSLGYDSVRNETGEIPYGNHEALEQYCYKEVSNIDIFVSIIGGRFGSESSESKWSISNEELKTAIRENKQVYIFIEKAVDNEYQTYLRNKGNDTIHYNYVDNVKIYEFIEEIHKLTTNNNIKTFESSGEIQDYLKEQFAGLFQSYLDANAKSNDVRLSRKLEELAEKFKDLSEQFVETKNEMRQSLRSAQNVTHPVVLRVVTLLDIQYGVWFDNYQKLNSLLTSDGWAIEDSEENYRWTRETSIASTIDVFTVSKTLFDDSGLLKQYNPSLPYTEMVSKTSESITEDDPNELPF